MNKETMQIDDRLEGVNIFNQEVVKAGKIIKSDGPFNDPYLDDMRLRLIDSIRGIYEEIEPYRNHLEKLAEEYWKLQESFDRKILMDLNSREYNPTKQSK